MNEESFKERERIRKNLLNIGIFMAQALLLVFAGPVLVRFFLPVIIGWLLAQMANPLVRFLERRLHIVRKHSSFVIILGVICLIVFLGYRAALWLIRESAALLTRLPAYYRALVEGMGRIAENLQGIASRMPPDTRERIAGLTGHATAWLGRLVSSLGGGTVEAAGNMAKNIPSLLASFLFALLFAYFFIAQREKVQRTITGLMPEAAREQLRLVRVNLKYAVGGYFRAQLKIMWIIGAILAVGFLAMRIEYAILLAVVIAFLDFLPMLGTGTVLLPWAMFCVLSDAISRGVGLLALYVVTQATRQLIQPKMVGDSIGIDALTTLFVLFIGYRASGIPGMIIAAPAGAILIQLYKAGVFDCAIQNARELAQTIRSWRS